MLSDLKTYAYMLFRGENHLSNGVRHWNFLERVELLRFFCNSEEILRFLGFFGKFLGLVFFWGRLIYGSMESLFENFGFILGVLGLMWEFPRIFTIVNF